jgi:hypothetical protein
MIVAIVAQGVVICALLIVLYLMARSASRERSDRADAYERTLQTLADRVQAPERLPVGAVRDFAVPDLEVDDWNRVGSIDYDEVREPDGAAG